MVMQEGVLMAFPRISYEQFEMLHTTFGLYKFEPFIWKDVKNIISFRVFRQMISRGIIIKHAKYSVGINEKCRNISEWKLNPDYGYTICGEWRLK